MSDLFAALDQIEDSLSFQSSNGHSFEAQSDRDALLQAALAVSALLPTVDHAPVGWSYVANADMSGLPTICTMPACRRQKLADTSAFAATFADLTILFNPFEYALLEITERDRLTDHDIDEILFALESVISLRPLIEAKLVQFMDYDPFRACVGCMGKLQKSMKGFDERSNAYLSTLGMLMDEIEVVPTRISDGMRVFEITGPSDLLGHEIMYYYITHSEELDRAFPVGKRLSKSRKAKMPFFHQRASLQSADTHAKSAISQLTGVKSVFSSSIELSLLKRMFGVDLRTQSSGAHLPILRTDEIGKLVKLREVEWAHFESYREIFFEVVKDVGSSGGNVEAAFRKHVLPEAI